MKRFVAFVLMIVLCAFVCCGCSKYRTVMLSKEVLSEQSTEVNAVSEQNIQESEPILANHTINSNESDECKDELTALWESDGRINFQIGDRYYAIGESCASILDNFQISEVEGCVLNDNFIPVCQLLGY